MVRMFLSTQILFAMSHTEVGLLSNNPGDKSLTIGGRAKVEAVEGVGVGAVTNEINRRQAMR